MSNGGGIPSGEEFGIGDVGVQPARRRKFYVATSTANLGDAELVVNLLLSLGHEISYDWTKQVREVGPADEGLDSNLRARIYENDRNGVNLAEVLIILGHPKVCGALIEMGMAMAWMKPIWLVGNLPRETVFLEYPNLERFANLHALSRRVYQVTP